jgi:hypothetical protein
MIMFDYGGGRGGGKKWQNIDNVICEQPLSDYDKI